MFRSLRPAALGVPMLAAFLPPAVAQSSLPDMVVTAPAIPRDRVGPVDGIRALTAESATRTATPINEIPQSIQVLPQQLLQEQGSVSLEDALRNAPAVQPPNPLNYNQTLTTRVRGFRAEVYRDGLSAFFDGGAAQSLLGVARIEVVKGPSGSLFGGGYGGGLGGLVNVVSLLPEQSNSATAGVRLGPYGFRNPFFDVNQRAGTIAADGTEVLVRVQGEHLQTRGFVDGIREDSHTLIPAVTVRNDRTSLTFQGFFSQRNATEYPGLPVAVAVNPGSFAATRFFNPNSPDAPRSVSARNGMTALLDHRIDDVWTARLAGRFSVTNLEEKGQGLFSTADPTLSAFPRANFYLTQDQTQVSAVPMLEGRFTTGPARHTLLVGAELDQVTDQGGTGFGFTSPFRLASPDHAPYRRPAPGPFQFDNRYTTVAAFVQDQVTLWDRLHLLGALRLAQLEIDSRDPSGAGFTATTSRLLPRVGIGYEVLPGVTPFLGWGQGMRGDPYVSLPSGTPQPEYSEQIEAGVKLDLGLGLAATLAYFDITRRNVAVADPNVLFAQRQTGEQRSHGFDAELLWQPNPHLSVLATYAHINAEVTEDTVLAKGTAVGYVPRDAGRVWASYRMLDTGPTWLRGVTFGAGVQAASGAPVGDGGTRTKGYMTFDAQVAYDSGPLRLALTGRNLADQDYFVAYEYFGGAVAPGAPRSVFLTAALRF